MEKIKGLITGLFALFLTVAFSQNASAQEVKIYKSTTSEYKFKIEFVQNGFEKVWVKTTPTSEWESRTVTYSDEELIKYTRVSNGQTYTFTLVFSNGDLSSFINHRADGVKEKYLLVN